MKLIRLQGFKAWTARKERRDGSRWESRPYYQHRASGLMIDTAKHPMGSASFYAEAQRLEAAWAAVRDAAPKPGTLGGLMAFFVATDHFRQNLSTRTRRDYLWCRDYLAPIGDVTVPALDTPLIAGIIDKAAAKHGWRRANYVLTFLRQVVRHARPHGLIDGDPTEGVIPKRRPKDAGYANRPWPDGEREEVFAAATPQLRAALAVMENTGLDPSDAIRVARSAEQDGQLRGIRGKTGVEIVIPIGERLAAALAEAPKHDATTLLASSKGVPWTYDGLATAFQRLRTKLEKAKKIAPGLTMKGLRHTVATVLREEGSDERAIADLLGQKTTSMAGHYSRSADLSRKNQETVRALDEARAKRRDGVKPFAPKRQT